VPCVVCRVSAAASSEKQHTYDSINIEFKQLNNSRTKKQNIIRPSHRRRCAQQQNTAKRAPARPLPLV
jgi:hypothetical protein